jgi:hypothetical protein
MKQNSATIEQDADLLPCSLALIKTIQFTTTNKPFCVLFNTASDNIFMHQEAIPTWNIVMRHQSMSGANTCWTPTNITRS